MNDPLRMREERPEDAASILLDHARADAPAEGFRNKLATGLGVGLSAAGSATAGVGGVDAAVASSKGLLFGKLLVGVGLLSLAGGLAWKSASEPAEHRSELRTLGAIQLARQATPERARPKREQQLEASGTNDPRATAAPSGRVVAGPTHVTKPRPRSVPRPALADEVSALDEARRALAGNDSKGALTRLADYDRNFPDARLGLEATILRIEALLERGEYARAARLAAQFRSAHPGSPHARRVDSLLARAKSAPPNKP